MNSIHIYILNYYCVCRYVVPMANAELDAKGLLSLLVKPQGTLESFEVSCSNHWTTHHGGRLQIVNASFFGATNRVASENGGMLGEGKELDLLISFFRIGRDVNQCRDSVYHTYTYIQSYVHTHQYTFAFEAFVCFHVIVSMMIDSIINGANKVSSKFF